MTAIWSNDGERWALLAPSRFPDEASLHTLIEQSPQLLRLAAAWFTNRHDPVFHNRQDVELVTLNPSGVVTKRQRITPFSNESEADPLLGGFFIGDYIEVFAHRGTALVHYNANYTQLRLLGEGLPIPQQDNYLSRRGL